MASLKLFLFGKPRLEVMGRPVELDTRKALALLAYLAVSRQAHSRESLATLLWPEYDASRAYSNLRKALWSLNHQVGPQWLDIRKEAVEIGAEADFWLDVHAFRDQLAETRTHGHAKSEVCPACRSPLEQAAALYQGDFMAGMTLRDSPGFDGWQSTQAEQLRMEAGEVFRHLVDLLAGQREFASGIGFSRRWLALDPLDEEAHCALMRLYAWNGQRNAALRQYQECMRVLQDELGVLPQAETTQLYQEIKANRLPAPEFLSTPIVEQHGSLRSEFPERSSARLQGRSWNLPATLNAFIGREAEIAALLKRLLHPEVRLLTLTGPGGVGKTRLSLRAGEILQSEPEESRAFPGGVFFVALDSINDPRLVLPTLVRSLGLSASSSTPASDVLKENLHDLQALLILDNFEQVIEAAPEVAELLASAPHLKIMVTSRTRLHLYGEHEFPVLPLSVTAADDPPDLNQIRQNEAVRLFVERAQAVQPQFNLNNENATAILEICAWLDGLPLAIELAAARLRVLPLQVLRARLDQRLPLLTGGGRNLPARQQTLRATLAWSYELLNEDEQRFFRRLGIFSGGFTIQAVERVCDSQSEAADPSLAILDRLSDLVERSLLIQPATDVSNTTAKIATQEPRFSMLETLREFACEKLAESGEQAEIQSLHAEYYLELAKAAEAHFWGSEQVAWLNRLEIEHANLRVALQWSLENGFSETGLRLSAALSNFWWWHGHWAEGRRWLEAALGQTQGLEIPARARALKGLGQIVWEFGEANQAVELYQRSLSLAEQLGDTWIAANTLGSLGYVAIIQGRYAEATARLERSFELYQNVGAPFGEAIVLNNLGVVKYYLGEFERSRQLWEESLDLARSIDNQWVIAVSLYRLGFLADRMGDAEQAGRYFRESLPYWQALHSPAWTASLLAELAIQALYRNEVVEAERLAVESLRLSRTSHDRAGSARALAVLGYTWLLNGQLERAQAALAEALAEHEGLAESSGESWLVEAAGWQNSVPFPHADDFGATAYILAGLAEAARQQDNLLEARQLIETSRKLFASLDSELSPVRRTILERITGPIDEALGKEI